MQPYDDTRTKGEQVEEMFDGIAHRYDLLNHVLSLGIDRGWRRRLIERLAANSPGRVLDLASGTGDVAIAAARKLPGANVVASDLSEGMLTVARRKIAAAGLNGRITAVCAAAEELPFGEGEFDAVTVAFGVRNFSDIAAGVREAARVLEPGGSLFVLEFSMPKNKLFGALYRFYFRRILPVVGGWISGDRRAYAYLPASVEEFPYGQAFVDLVLANGFAECSAQTLTFGVATLYSAKKAR